MTEEAKPTEVKKAGIVGKTTTEPPPVVINLDGQLFEIPVAEAWTLCYALTDELNAISQPPPRSARPY